MQKLNMKSLENLRETKRAEMARTEKSCPVEIIIGMGTCGIAAGARSTFNTFTEELKKAGIEGALVKQTGCIGQCYAEPTVEVHVQGLPDIIYGRVDEETARRIVRKHIIEKSLVQDRIFDRPSGDIVGKGTY